MGSFEVSEDYRDARGLERICLMGPPGGGKTKLAGDLPFGTPKWGERGIYIASDSGSAGLDSVSFASRERLIPVYLKPSEVNGKLVIDTNAFMCEALSNNWKAQYPDVGTIIVDTFTEPAKTILGDIADSGVTGGHVTVGAGVSRTNNPSPSDYGLAQQQVTRWLKFAFGQPLNLVAIFHGDFVEPEQGESGTIFGGPATVGKALVRYIAGKFHNVFLVECKNQSVRVGNEVKVQTKYMVHTEQKGIWHAKIRLGGPNPMPSFDITNNTKGFWEAYDKAKESN